MTTPSTDLVLPPPAPLATDTWRDLTDLAGKLSRSGLIPGPLRNKPDDVLVVLLSGRELGIQPMLALRSIHVIDGKPVLSADLAAALVLRSPLRKEFRCVKMTDTECTYRAQRVDEEEGTDYSFTMKDAERAGLAGRQNWRNYPKAMLKARACMMAARAHFPDLVASVYETDEIEAPVAEAKPVTALDAFKAQHRAEPVPVEPETATAHVVPDREPDTEEPAPAEPEVAPDEWRLLADELIARLDKVKHAKHLENWRKRHAAEMASLKTNAPAEHERVVAAGQAAKERVG